MRQVQGQLIGRAAPARAFFQRPFHIEINLTASPRVTTGQGRERKRNDIRCTRMIEKSPVDRRNPVVIGQHHGYLAPRTFRLQTSRLVQKKTCKRRELTNAQPASRLPIVDEHFH